MTDLFRCIHCNNIYPHDNASVMPMPVTEDNPLPIGVCRHYLCRREHDACKNQKPGGQVANWRDIPRDYWGMCLDCKGAVWLLRPGTWHGSWSWVCSKCGGRWKSTPPEDEVQKE